MHYNEALEAGGARGFYGPLLEALARLAPEMGERRGRADEELRRLGATFPLPEGEAGEAGGAGGDRVPPTDWVPRLIPRGHWEKPSAGLLQRGKALNAWLLDLHNGNQDVVPREIVESSAFYRPGPLPEGSTPILVYGPDVIHLGDGEYVVLEDNVRSPSGVAYAEAIREAGMAAMPEIFAPYNVGGVRPYYGMLRKALEAAVPARGPSDPSFALVTGGPDDPAFFEHGRIAHACGLRLLTPEELRFEGGRVLAPDGGALDVIYRRFDDGFLSESLPELAEAHRADRVGLANAPGVGIADDKAVFPYVPAMIERYLGETPILRTAHTLSLGDPDGLAEALERLPEMVVKPRDGYGGRGVLVGPEAGAEEMERARREVKEDPMGFVAQECLDLSTHLLGGENEGEEAFVDLRAFVLPAVDYVMPGGLTRVAVPGTRVVNSSAGGGLKDTWVLEGPGNEA